MNNNKTLFRSNSLLILLLLASLLLINLNLITYSAHGANETDDGVNYTILQVIIGIIAASVAISLLAYIVLSIRKKN